MNARDAISGGDLARGDRTEEDFEDGLAQLDEREDDEDDDVEEGGEE